MKITKRQIRMIINESFVVPDSRRGWAGMGFGGQTNSYDPYRRHSLHEEELPLVHDVWAGGENLAHPTDNLKADTDLENVNEPEILDLTLSERRLRAIIRNALKQIKK